MAEEYSKRSVSTSDEGGWISVKNSFIHVRPVSMTTRPRTLSAPDRFPSADERILANCSSADDEASPVVSGISLADHQFRPDIFYTVFSSPVCERPEANLPPGTTTVMVRNIPTRFTSVSFLRILDECGFRNSFNFFYLPMDFRTGKNMGYCFLNFANFSVTVMFASLFHGRRLRMTTSTKVIEISPSRRQGLLENVALFKASDLLGSLSLPHFKPLVMVAGSLRPLSERTYFAVFREYEVGSV